MGKQAVWRTVVVVVAIATTAGVTMSNKDNDGRVDYIEFRVENMERSKAFYGEAFGWKLTDYGPDYTSFDDGRLSGGFTVGDVTSRGGGGTLVVLYAVDLEAMQAGIEAAGGAIVKPIFSFPGGRRFHFHDPSGNELAVWSDK